MTNNHSEFNGKHYHQVSGTAMGTNLAPSYCNRMVVFTPYYHWEQVLLLYLNTKLKYLLLFKICCIYIYPKFIHKYNNVTVHIK